MVTAFIGNLAAGAASTAARNAADPAAPISAESIYWPAWILVGGVLVALLVVIGVLTSIKTMLQAKPKKRDEEFTRMVCRQVWKHTDVIKGTFHERLRQPQSDVVTLRVLLRLLREDLAGPMNFVSQMRCHAPDTWPNYSLFAAFNNWSGKIAAIESQLADMQQMLSYPAVKEPVDAHRDQMLVHYFTTEQAPLGYTIGQVVTCAIAVCEEGKLVIAAAHSHGFKNPFGDHHDDDHHPVGCSACDGPLHAPWVSNDPRLILLVPPPPPVKKDKKEEPKPQLCYCVVPQPCHCTPAACICACSCKSTAGEARHPH